MVAPESWLVCDVIPGERQASMRPGHGRPGKKEPGRVVHTRIDRFNEAGAWSPRKVGSTYKDDVLGVLLQ